MNDRRKGIAASLASALLLGLTPIFGKQSILQGFSPLAVVAVRSSLAVALLFLFIVIFKRGFFYIHPLGLLGCFFAGFINGVGSIFYYTALTTLDASIGQLLYSFYPLFVALWLLADRQSLSRVTILRLILALAGAYLLIANSTKSVNLVGAAMMVGAALLYALHLLVNQRVLYEAPAPTVTFYTLLSMAVTVTGAFLIFHPSLPPSGINWWPLVVLGLITFLSRLTLFLGVKHLGGLQTSLLGLGELLVTIVMAQIFLGERLTIDQWIGTLLIGINLLLVAYDQPGSTKRYSKGFLHWLNPTDVSPTDFPFKDQ